MVYNIQPFILQGEICETNHNMLLVLLLIDFTESNNTETSEPATSGWHLSKSGILEHNNLKMVFSV